MAQLRTASARHKHARSFPRVDAGLAHTALTLANDTDTGSTQR